MHQVYYELSSSVFAIDIHRALGNTFCMVIVSKLTLFLKCLETCYSKILYEGISIATSNLKTVNRQVIECLCHLLLNFTQNDHFMCYIGYFLP